MVLKKGSCQEVVTTSVLLKHTLNLPSSLRHRSRRMVRDNVERVQQWLDYHLTPPLPGLLERKSKILSTRFSYTLRYRWRLQSLFICTQDQTGVLKVNRKNLRGNGYKNKYRSWGRCDDQSDWVSPKSRRDLRLLLCRIWGGGQW